jgi:hypothetical protein
MKGGKNPLRLRSLGGQIIFERLQQSLELLLARDRRAFLGLLSHRSFGQLAEKSIDVGGGLWGKLGEISSAT